jgi:hypothetical protein
MGAFLAFKGEHRYNALVNFISYVSCLSGACAISSITTAVRLCIATVPSEMMCPHISL